MENHLFPTKLHHHHLFKEGFSQWDSHGKTELFKMHSNFIRRILHLQSKLSSLGHLPRSASKNTDRLLYIYKNSISSALGGRKEGRKEDSPGQKQLGKVCGLEQEWLLHVEKSRVLCGGEEGFPPETMKKLAFKGGEVSFPKQLLPCAGEEIKLQLPASFLGKQEKGWA